MTTAGRDIVVIGDALLDVTARPQSPIRVGGDVPAQIRIGCGGQGANLAVRLARQGVRVELVCALGDDPGGTLVRAALAEEGVLLTVVAAEATGTVVILLDEAGERTMLSQRAPFAALAASVVRVDAAWLIASGYLLLEADAGVLTRTLAAAPARRALVGCAVPKAMADRWSRAAAAMQPDIVILNRDEAFTLLPGATATGHLTARLGEHLRSGVVVTEAGGATARMNGVSVDVRAPSGTPPADSTGAGDAFAAALVDELRRSPWPPPASALSDALVAATELASAVAHAPGAQGQAAGERKAIVRP